MAERLGLRPRDFTRGQFKLKTSPPGEMPHDDDLFRTVTAGIPSAGMPAFPDFNETERWALVAYVKCFSSFFDTHRARTRLSLVAPERLDPDRGARLFRDMQCVACHGPCGQGDGPAASAIEGGVPDWTRAVKAGEHVEDVFRVLATGVEGTAMPSFASLPERDRWDIAAWVAALYPPAHE